MTDNDNYIEELLAFYALGALTDEEREQVESYLAEHPELRAQIKKLEYSASALPYGVAPVRPSDQARKKLMARVAADQQTRAANRGTASDTRATRPRNRFLRFPQLAFSALSLVIAVVAVTSMFFLNAQVSRLQSEVAALQEALLAQADTVRELNVALEQVNARLPQATPPAFTTFSISGTLVQPDAHAQLLTDPNSNSAVLVVSGLDPLPAGKIYQIWLIEGDTPKSAGLLTVNAQGQGVSVLTRDETIASYNALGVSIEPEEGSTQPTGDIVLLGEFN